MRQKTEVQFIAPFPPPVHGQSAATASVAQWLRDHGFQIQKVDISEDSLTGVAAIFYRILMHVRAVVFCLFGSAPVYISTNSNNGMWLTAMVVGVVRLRRRRLFIHHHAYDHVRRRRCNMVWMARIGGPHATHIVLGESMAISLKESTPEVKKTFVLNNAGLVDDRLISLARADRGLVLGQLSNLIIEKGVPDAVNLAIAAEKAGILEKFVLAGPINDLETKDEIVRAREALGDHFEYRGPVFGADKLRFFQDITCFVFPTKYRNEASPLVLLEAMAAGVPCVAYGLGCIADDIGAAGGLVVEPNCNFTEVAFPFIKDLQSDFSRRSNAARMQYRALLENHRGQLEAFRATLTE